MAAPVDVRSSLGERAALEVLGVAWQRAAVRFGERIGGGTCGRSGVCISGGHGAGHQHDLARGSARRSGLDDAIPIAGGPIHER